MASDKKATEFMDNLKLHDVLMSSGYFEAEREPEDDEPHNAQYFNHATHIYVDDNLDDTEQHRASVKYECGIRLINPEDVDSEGEPYTYFEIIGHFEARYYLKEKIDLSCENTKSTFMEASGYDIWPYWREYVKNCCARLGIQGLNIGPYPASSEAHENIK